MSYEKSDGKLIGVEIPEVYNQPITTELAKDWRKKKLKLLKKKLSAGTITKREIAYLKYLIDFNKEDF